MPLIILDWNDQDTQCFLTYYQRYFEELGKGNEVTLEEVKEINPVFFRPILKKYLNIDVDQEIADKINYYVFVIPWLLTYFRFLRYHNINIA